MNYMYVKKNSHNNTHVERRILSGNKHPYSTIQFDEIKLYEKKLIKNKQINK